MEGKLQEFEYQKGVAIRWHLAGENSDILIDPQVSFGAPSIKGIPTWTLKNRLDAGESVEDIAEDFSLEPLDVVQALEFEGVEKTKILDASTECSH